MALVGVHLITDHILLSLPEIEKFKVRKFSIAKTTYFNRLFPGWNTSPTAASYLCKPNSE
jgi:hypothetical protein